MTDQEIANVIRALRVGDRIKVSWTLRKASQCRTVTVTAVSEVDGSLYVCTTSGRSTVRSGGVICIRKNGEMYYSPTLLQGSHSMTEISVIDNNEFPPQNLPPYQG
ncbi:MAG: hypothetical protein E6R03_00825 [Hyphomicrobiaceae bacterium]|nr:MAG: hypothetical protein E6R03_00825 [Hyphomicrobiaceae bacterium]